jgi:FAD:protein FMN transferase
MGGQITAVLDTNDPRVDQGLNDVLAWLINIEQSSNTESEQSTKIWIMEQAMQRLAPYGPVLVEIDGGIMVSGPRPDGTPWPIGVVDPFRKDRHLDMLLLQAGGVYTAHRDREKAVVYSTPTVDEPSLDQNNVLAATVVAPQLLDAQAIARKLLSLSGEAGLNLLEQQSVEGFAGIIVLDNGTVYRSSKWVMTCLPHSQ